VSRSSIAISRDGTPIAFDCGGSGQALILVEPAGQYRGLSAFDDIVPLLTPEFTVCRYDRRGRGESGDTLPYGPEREVEDLAAVVDAIGGRAFAYGYSSGALLALYAAARGVPLAGLALMEPPLQADAAPRPDPLTEELAELIRAGRDEEAVAHFHAAIGVPEEMIAEMRRSDRWARIVGIAPTLVYDCRLSDAVELGVLAAVRVPTLVLDSAGSSEDLTGSAATAARLIPGALHRSMPGEWHVVAPDLIAHEIKAHFGSLAQPMS
jgi:pimeloyl-ACP methyl ester carboxylesterase